MNRPDIDTSDLDGSARALHAGALSHLSAATMAQLHRRRQAALEGAATARRARWPFAAAFASVLALAIGLGLGLQGARAPEPPAPSLAAAGDDPGGPVPASAQEIDDALASFDQAPDFYLWLASSDATLLAME